MGGVFRQKEGNVQAPNACSLLPKFFNVKIPLLPNPLSPPKQLSEFFYADD